MKIRIVTNRTLKAEDYWVWADSVVEGCKLADARSPITHQGFKQLFDEGKVSYTTDLGHTKIITTYEIVEQ